MNLISDNINIYSILFITQKGKNLEDTVKGIFGFIISVYLVFIIHCCG